MNLGSVRVRLTLWNIGALALALVTFALAVAFLVRTSVYDSVDQQLSDSADHYAGEWLAHLRFDSFGPGPGSFGPSGHPFPPGPGPDFPGSDGGHFGPHRHFDSGGGPHGDHFGPGGEHFGSGGGQFGPGPGGFHGFGPPPLPNRTGGGMLMEPRTIGLNGHVLMPPDKSDIWDIDAFHLAAAGTQSFSNVWREGAEYRVLSIPLVHHSQINSVLQLAYPLGDLHRLLGELTQVLLALAPLEVFAAGLVGLFLTARALRPVRHIREVAREITASDLSRRIEVTGHDEMSELASTINDMIGRLQQSFAQQKRFVADASHELRTPLATVKTSTTLALSQDRDPAAYREALQVTDRAVDRMHRIVEDLLLLARSDSSQIDLEMQPTPIADLLQYSVEMLNPEGMAPVQLQTPDRSVMVMADVEYLVRVFVNLLTNAARHTPPSGYIVVSAYPDGNTVVAEVIDTGEGIPEEHLAHLGEPFYRADRSRARQHGGTGLGLAISKSIVQAHAGSLEIRSRVGQGTTAAVRLPRYEEPDSGG